MNNNDTGCGQAFTDNPEESIGIIGCLGCSFATLVDGEVKTPCEIDHTCPIYDINSIT